MLEVRSWTPNFYSVVSC